MPVPKDLLKYLKKQGVKFEVVPHKKVYTAYDLAQTLGEKLEKIAKSLLLEVEIPGVKKTGKKHYIVVIPASYRANFEKIKKALKAKKVSIAPEKMITKLGVKPGALTPFGGMRGVEVLLDRTLLKAKDILVGAESFTESLRVKVKDLHKLEKAIVSTFGEKAKMGKPKKKSKIKNKKYIRKI
jgi:prolyl-tRNA editing enzyme YbaK/EbsC (Cys-tRNA(Pro) deacylase)